MTDTISDMLTRIRNASRVQLPAVELPHSKMKESIANILKKEGYVGEVSVEGKLPKKIKLKLKYEGKKSVIEGIRRQAGAVEIHPGITVDLEIEESGTTHLQRADTREFRGVWVVVRWSIAGSIMMPHPRECR